MLEEFRQYVSDEELACLGQLVAKYPKSSFDRSVFSQFGIAVVGAGIFFTCLAVSFLVVVSDKPEEQLPFMQAMWGFAGVGGVLFLFGLGTGLWRIIFGVAGVGRWWLLGERGIVIVNKGAVEHAGPLTEVHVKTPSSITSKPKLVDQTGRSLPLPLNAEEALTRAIQEQQ